MIDDKIVEEAVVQGSYLTEEDITTAKQQASREQISLVDALLGLELTTADIIGQAMAEKLGRPYADLNSNPPDEELLSLVPAAVAQQHRLIIIDHTEKTATVATDRQDTTEAEQLLAETLPEVQVQFAYGFPDDIDEQLLRFKQQLSTRFEEILQKKERIAPELLDAIITDAIALHASDVHIEPKREEALVRFRVDGVMQVAGSLPIAAYTGVLNRVKVLGQLRIDEHQVPQDGAIQFDDNGTEIDLRVSLAPTVEGEKVVLRVLSQYVRGLSLPNLGMTPQDLELFDNSIRKPFGMVLVAGPTGSGKTTSLYAGMKRISRPDINITTIEDPVEYRLEAASQIQVNPDAGLTFSSGLRSIVRQDPDVILVGEIRDTETAEIAVNAALTGHLLFSTFHANDAAGSIPRLLDMGIEPFLLSSTLEVVMAQRLIRRICEDCRISVDMTPTAIGKEHPEAKKFFTKKATLYRGAGCEICGHSGYKGRTGVFELMRMTSGLAELIHGGANADQLWAQARKDGAVSMYENGIEKVRQGLTTLDELHRVVSPPADL